jgi:hypothetical protein
MADLDKIMRALRNAHAAGDTEAAKRLAKMARDAEKGASGVTQEQKDRIAAAKAGTLEVSPERLAEQKKFDDAGMKDAVASTYQPGRLASFAAGAAQGGTFGFADEIVAGLHALSPNDTYDAALQRTRGLLDASRRDHPGVAYGGEVAGAVAAPVGVATSAATKGAAIAKGAAAGAGMGGAYAFGQGEGGFDARSEKAKSGALAGALIGGLAPVVADFGSRAFRTAFGMSQKRPTVENLRATKNAAYRAVEDAGDVFSPAEVSGLVANVNKTLDDLDYVGGFGQSLDAQLARLNKLSERGEPVTLTRLDDIRGRLWKAYSKATDETEFLDVIGAIDDLIETRAASSDAMKAARLANSRFKKAEMLDLAFQKASDQTASTGSGGNILNKYRQAVTAIINDPKRAKWFSAEEISAMRAFLTGKMGENFLRRVGKLSPSGNGLMQALNLAAVATNPAAIVGSAAAAGAKAVSDGAAKRGADRLIGMVGGMNPLAVRPNYPTIGGEVAPVASYLSDWSSSP